ncbi:MAG: hypothetical protein NVV82_27285 [Sporocytophaga sp.]|nr:hypothetical protein [Sporocytophaga sp.]
MKIEFEKFYSYKSKSSIPAIIGVPILLILIPLILLVVVIFLVFAGITSVFSNKRKNTDRIIDEQKPYFLIKRDNFTIELVEHDDEEYTSLEDYWYSDVYDEDTTLYLAKTSPEIPGLHNKFITTFMKEIKDGVMLQIVEYPGEMVSVPSSWIIYLNYHSLNIERLDEIGPYLLYNNDQDMYIIEGFNQGGKIQLKIKMPGGM